MAPFFFQLHTRIGSRFIECSAKSEIQSSQIISNDSKLRRLFQNALEGKTFTKCWTFDIYQFHIDRF